MSALSGVKRTSTIGIKPKSSGPVIDVNQCQFAACDHPLCDSGEATYLGGRVESSNCRSDSTFYLHFVRNSPLSSRVAHGKRGIVSGRASAVIGRPLTPGSVAGVNRRVHRRAYRHGYYGYGYGAYRPYYRGYYRY
jgi:hypothetical protein